MEDRLRVLHLTDLLTYSRLKVHRIVELRLHLQLDLMKHVLHVHDGVVQRAALSLHGVGLLPGLKNAFLVFLESCFCQLFNFFGMDFLVCLYIGSFLILKFVTFKLFDRIFKSHHMIPFGSYHHSFNITLCKFDEMRSSISNLSCINIGFTGNLLQILQIDVECTQTHVVPKFGVLRARAQRKSFEDLKSLPIFTLLE